MAILHKNISAEGDIHNPKWFSGANNGDVAWRNELGVLESTDELVLPAALNFVDGSVAPPTSNSGDIYVLSSGASVNAGWGTVALGDWVRYDGTTWNVITPQKSTLCYNETLDKLFSYSGSVWAEVGGGGGGGNTIYTANDTIGTGRVATVTDTIRFKDGTFEIQGLGTADTNLLSLYNGNTTPDKLWDFKDNGNIISDNGAIVIGLSSNLYNSKLHVKGQTTLQADSSSGYVGGWAKSTGANISAVYGNGKMVFGGFNPIGSEILSLQGSTLIKGIGTTGSSALAIYDGDGTPAKLWDFLDNGRAVSLINSASTNENILSNYGITLRNTNSTNDNIQGIVFQDNSIDQQVRIYTRFGTKNSLNFDIRDGNLQNAFNYTDNSFNIFNNLSGDANGNESLTIEGQHLSAIVGSGARIGFKQTNSNSYGAYIKSYTFGAGNTGLGFATGFGSPTVKMTIDGNGKVNMSSLPTSSSGLSSGDLYSDSGTIKIVA